MKYEDSRKVAVHHEIVNLLDIDGYPCNDDQNYRNDFCRNDFIHKVIEFYFVLISTDFATNT